MKTKRVQFVNWQNALRISRNLIMPTKDYQTDLLKRLANCEYAAQYLKAAFEKTLADGNKLAFLLALKKVVDATVEV